MALSETRQMLVDHYGPKNALKGVRASVEMRTNMICNLTAQKIPGDQAVLEDWKEQLKVQQDDVAELERMIDPATAMRPVFSLEQMEYLTDLLTPYRCHVSGEHYPTHFADDLEWICNYQAREAFDWTRKSLGIKTKGRPKPNCGWCKRKGAI